MRPFLLLYFLISLNSAQAQTGFQSHVTDGQFYGIFPADDHSVIYADTLVFAGIINRDNLSAKAKEFFDKKEDATYYFESENKDSGELIYQGEFHTGGLASEKTNIHFSLVLNMKDSVCAYKLTEIVLASTEVYYSPSAMPGSTAMVKSKGEDRATQLENIDMDKTSYSRKYFEKLNKRFTAIMDGLNAALR
jgi:hypothetical protein